MQSRLPSRLKNNGERCPLWVKSRRALVLHSSREGFYEAPELEQKKKCRVAKWAKLVPTRQKTPLVIAI